MLEIILDEEKNLQAVKEIRWGGNRIDDVLPVLLCI